MQTRSITKRAGVPHDLEAFNSYAEDLTFYVDESLKTKKRKIDFDIPEDNEKHDAKDHTYNPSDSEDSDNEKHDAKDHTYNPSDSEDSDNEKHDAKDHTYKLSDSEDSENESTNSEWFPEDTRIPGWGYDPKHFCPSWVKCCEDNLKLKQ